MRGKRPATWTLAAAATVVAVASAWLSVVAGPTTATVRGKVRDPEGNPLPGVQVIFTNPQAPDTKYDTKTSKKGAYYISNLLHYPNSENWNLSVVAEGMVVTHLAVRSWNQQAVVDKFESDLPPGSEIPAIRIVAFGEATIDLVLTPEDQVATPEGIAVEGAVEGGEEAAAPARDPWEAAVEAASSGDLTGSIPWFEKAIEKEPESAERRVALAQVFYKLERHGEAAKQAVQATRIAPESLEAQMVLYSVYIATDNLDGAAAALESARAVAPDDVRVLRQGAFLAERQGDGAAAIRSYEDIVRVEPGDADAWVALGGLYAEAGDSAKSEAAYAKVAELNPSDAYEVFYNIGVLIVNRPDATDADRRKAVDAFRRAVEIKPDYALAHQQLGFALLGTGDLAGARGSLERYLELRPDAADAGEMKALVQGLR